MSMWNELTFRDCKSGGWQWQKSRVWNPERADMLWLAMSAAYARMLSLGAKVWLSPKIQRAAVGGDPDSVNVFSLGLILFQNRLWNRRRIPCALKLPTGLRAAKKVQGSKLPSWERARVRVRVTRASAALRAGRPRSRADCRDRPADGITRGAMLWIPSFAGMTG